MYFLMHGSLKDAWFICLRSLSSGFDAALVVLGRKIREILLAT
jgi:hypothetical protein